MVICIARRNIAQNTFAYNNRLWQKNENKNCLRYNKMVRLTKTMRTNRCQFLIDAFFTTHIFNLMWCTRIDNYTVHIYIINCQSVRIKPSEEFKSEPCLCAYKNILFYIFLFFFLNKNSSQTSVMRSTSFQFTWSGNIYHMTDQIKQK